MESTIGERIANLRKKNGLTQLQLAEKLNISDKAVSKWESNKGDPSVEMLALLSNVLECSIDYIVTGKGKNSSTFDEVNFVNKCFQQLEQSISPDVYKKFNQTYKYVGIDDKCFCFETRDKDLYQKSFDTDENDGAFDKLIEIAIKTNKEYNGYKLKLIEQESKDIKKSLSYADEVFSKSIDILKCYITAMTYELWVSTIKPIKIEDTTFIVSVPSKIIKDYIKKNLYVDILEALQRIDGRLERIHILVEDLSTDKVLRDAVKLAITTNSISASKIQAILMVGYPTAADLIFTMEQLGFISKRNEHNVREIYITKERFAEEFKELWFED